MTHESRFTDAFRIRLQKAFKFIIRSEQRADGFIPNQGQSFNPQSQIPGPNPKSSGFLLTYPMVLMAQNHDCGNPGRRYGNRKPAQLGNSQGNRQPLGKQQDHEGSGDLEYPVAEHINPGFGLIDDHRIHRDVEQLFRGAVNRIGQSAVADFGGTAKKERGLK